MIRIFVIILFCSSISWVDLFAQAVITDYNSFIKKVKEQNPLMNQAENTKQLGSFQLDAARGAFDPQINAGSSQKSFDGTKYYTLHDAELKQQLYTSQYFKAGYQYQFGPYVNPENKTSQYGIPYAGLEMSLLQGLRIDSKRAALQKAGFMKDYLDAESRLMMNEVLYQASQQYTELLFMLQLQKLGIQFTTLASERLIWLRNLTNIGERAAIDTVEASIQLQTRQLELQGYNLDIIRKYNELKTVSALDQTNVVMADTSGAEFNVLFDKARTQALSRLLSTEWSNPIIAQYESKTKMVEIDKRLKREMIKPVLDVSYNVLHNMNGPTDNPISVNNYKWSANFSMPLFLRKSRNEYKMANIYLENVQLEQNNYERVLSNKRENAASAIKILEQQINLAQQANEYNKRLVDAERLKFENGESTLFILNQRETKWLESSAKLLELQMKYMKSCFELIYIDGDLGYEL
jgi:outer membrane protein TolC